MINDLRDFSFKVLTGALMAPQKATNVFKSAYNQKV